VENELMAPVVDIHQHLWPEPFVAALGRRTSVPRLRGSVLELAHEPAVEIDLAAYDPDRRLTLLDRDEIDVAVVSLSPALGIGGLPADEGAELVAAYEEGIREVSAAVGGRIVPLAASEPLDGFAGLCIDARRLADLERLASTLDELDRREALLFVHPGPGNQGPGPTWWSEVVDYTAQMQAAYAGWLALGADRWPTLRIVFAILAGGGPFQLERLASRGVDVRDTLHQNVFFDTASYGRRALELCLATFGVGQLVYGSDTPVIDSGPTLDAVRGFGEAVVHALCRDNTARLLTA
jgi:6-methylsalicylate decarboxylase